MAPASARPLRIGEASSRLEADTGRDLLLFWRRCLVLGREESKNVSDCSPSSRSNPPKTGGSTDEPDQPADHILPELIPPALGHEVLGIFELHVGETIGSFDIPRSKRGV